LTACAIDADDAPLQHMSNLISLIFCILLIETFIFTQTDSGQLLVCNFILGCVYYKQIWHKLFFAVARTFGIHLESEGILTIALSKFQAAFQKLHLHLFTTIIVTVVSIFVIEHWNEHHLLVIQTSTSAKLINLLIILK